MQRVYRSFYINGAGLRKALLALKNSDVESPEARFTELVAEEIHKVNQFTSLKQQEVKMEMQLCARKLKTFLSAGSPTKEKSPSGGSPNATKAPDSSPRQKEFNAANGKDFGAANPKEPGAANPKEPGAARRKDGSAKKLPGVGRSPRGLTKEEEKLSLAEVEGTLSDISSEIVHLDNYVRGNFSTLVRTAVYFDGLFNVSSSPWFVAQLIKEPFALVDIDCLLITLGLCWEKYRAAEAIRTGALAATEDQKDSWKPPETFVRNTTKYWIRSSQVTNAKAFILRYVPHLIFGYTSKQLQYLIDPYDVHAQRPPEGQRVEEGQLVSSIYLDSEGGYCYYNRINRFEGAQLIRCRWYGENDGYSYKEIFVERKTHHESWTGYSSTKERFSLPQKRVFDFLKGKVDIDEWANYLSEARGIPKSDKKITNLMRLGTEISDFIGKHRLQPMVRTSYLRSAFQASDNNDVRFSLDVNLCMVNEFQPNNHPNPPWCRVSEEILGKDQVVRFPFAVLEVKLQTEQPSWVSKMLCACHAKVVYKFSKFQHGMAFLHRDKVSQFGMPHWTNDFENRGYLPGFSVPLTADQEETYISSYMTDGGRPMLTINTSNMSSGISGQSCSPTAQSTLRYNAMLSTEHKSFMLANFYPGNSSRRASHRVFESPSKAINSHRESLRPKNFHMRHIEDPHTPSRENYLNIIASRAQTIRKLDPKSIFASERTLLHYISKCLYMMAVGLALIEGSSNRISKGVGIFICLVVCGGIIFSYIVHVKRTERILSRRCKESKKEKIDSVWAPKITFYALSGCLIASIVAIIFSDEYQMPMQRLRVFLFNGRN